MKITVNQLRQIIREEISKVNLKEDYEDLPKQIPSVVAKLDAMAKRFAFKLAGTVNKNPKGYDRESIAVWRDTIPGYQNQSIELYNDDGELSVFYKTFNYKSNKRSGSGSDPAEEFFGPKFWKFYFGSVEDRKKGTAMTSL